ncbi:MAG: hypothetical protein GQ532_04690 [Methylomarinum sp.]|nr:hypothetical protein [Methylomarinum sp.]
MAGDTSGPLTPLFVSNTFPDYPYPCWGLKSTALYSLEITGLIHTQDTFYGSYIVINGPAGD